MIAAVVAINKADVRAYISENESLENVMSDRILCLSFMQSTRSLELGTGSEGPATKICDLQKTSPSPPHHQSPLRNVIRMDPKDWQRHTSNKPFVHQHHFLGQVRQAILIL